MTHALTNLTDAEHELYTFHRDESGPDWCQAYRDEVTDRCVAIRRAAIKAYKATQDFHDCMDTDLVPDLVESVAVAFLGGYERPENTERSIMDSAVWVLIEGGEV